MEAQPTATESAKKDSEGTNEWTLLAWAFVFVIFVAVLYHYLVLQLPANERGTFGDGFGGLNAIFSGLAFAGLIVALWMQRREIQMQREELRLALGEYKQQSTALKGQLTQLRIERYETSISELVAKRARLNLSMLRPEIVLRYYRDQVLSVHLLISCECYEVRLKVEQDGELVLSSPIGDFPPEQSIRRKSIEIPQLSKSGSAELRFSYVDANGEDRVTDFLFQWHIERAASSGLLGGESAELGDAFDGTIAAIDQELNNLRSRVEKLDSQL